MRSSSCFRVFATARGCSRPAITSHITSFNDWLNHLDRQPVEGGPVLHGLNEIQASLRSVGLQLTAVHGVFIESGCVRCCRWLESALVGERRGSPSHRRTFPDMPSSRGLPVYDDPLPFHRRRRRGTTVVRSAVLGCCLLGHLAGELFDAPHGRIELFHSLSFGLGDVGETLLLLHMYASRGVERLEAHRPKIGVTLSGDHVLRERGDIAVDLGDDLRPSSSEQRRVHGLHRVDEGVCLFDELHRGVGPTKCPAFA